MALHFLLRQWRKPAWLTLPYRESWAAVLDEEMPCQMEVGEIVKSREALLVNCHTQPKENTVLTPYYIVTTEFYFVESYHIPTSQVFRLETSQNCLCSLPM